jgi:hypothetical protein
VAAAALGRRPLQRLVRPDCRFLDAGRSPIATLAKTFRRFSKLLGLPLQDFQTLLQQTLLDVFDLCSPTRTSAHRPALCRHPLAECPSLHAHRLTLRGHLLAEPRTLSICGVAHAKQNTRHRD